MVESTVLEIFDYWRSQGFPYYQLSVNEKDKEFNNFVNYDKSKILQDNVIKQTMHGLALIWSYFPHHWEVKVGKMLTPKDIWNDDKRFVKAIESRIKNNGYLIDEFGKAYIPAWSMRKGLSRASGGQRVSNFRPTAAAAIYDKFSGNGAVWDMSCGYGGRLLGAIGSKKLHTYYGSEPATLTFQGLQQLTEEFGKDKNIKIVQRGSEFGIGDLIEDNVDLCFTSPPYFSNEMYSNECTQSAIKFSTVSDWNEFFLRKTITNAREVLKSNGTLILNVANVKSHNNLEADTLKIAKEEGFELTAVYQLTLSNISKGGFKYEPIFVFGLK